MKYYQTNAYTADNADSYDNISKYAVTNTSSIHIGSITDYANDEYLDLVDEDTNQCDLDNDTNMVT